ncbi:MAG: serine/threonine-protein kinase [Pirellulaceae bacterium]|nr:serine/threonine-protein kinase [Pirellulaceae bacterium]
MTADTRILGIPVGASAVNNGPAFVGALPESIAGYTLIRVIGQGGMGCVYEARHETLGKHFALKLLSDSLRDNSEAIDRFRCETLALGKLDHPNIVMASDAGVWQGRPFLVTELLKGQDLASCVGAAGQLDVESVISIAMQLSDALSFAHQHGYFHRDIKPSNVFYQPDGTAKLLDFGLVRSTAHQSLTQAGCLMGTVDFVAPEQACNASQADAASDIYSLGCTLIYLLSGDVPFPDCRYPSLTAKLHAHLHDKPRWLEQPQHKHPRWLVDLIQAMVAKSPSERPASCQLIHASLKNRNHLSCPPSLPTAQEPICGKANVKRKLAIGSGIAVGVTAASWLLIGSLGVFGSFVGTRTAPQNTTSLPSPTAQLEPDDQNDDTKVDTNRGELVSTPSQTSIAAASSAATHPKEKTLPVSVTHNARGASLPFKSVGSSKQPSVFLSKAHDD